MKIMAYSTDFRKRVIDFLEEGNSLRKAQKIFKVSLNAGLPRVEKIKGGKRKRKKKEN
jgi:transposase